MEPITRKEMFMAKAAGQNVNVPEPITREEMFLNAIGSGGGTGGGAQPDWNAAEGEAGHILNRTHHLEKAEGTVFDMTDLVYDESSSCFQYYGDPLHLIVGEKYEIHYLSGTYECVAYDSEMLGESGGIVMGNIGALTGGDDTGEPFVAIVPQSDYVFPITGVPAMTFYDLAGNGVVNAGIDGTHYKAKKIGQEWLQPGSVRVLKATAQEDVSGYLIVSIPCSFAAAMGFLLSGNDLIVEILRSSGIRLRLRCTSYEKSNIVFHATEQNGSGLRNYRLALTADNSVPSLAITDVGVSV